MSEMKYNCFSMKFFEIILTRNHGFSVNIFLKRFENCLSLTIDGRCRYREIHSARRWRILSVINFSAHWVKAHSHCERQRTLTRVNTRQRPLTRVDVHYRSNQTHVNAPLHSPCARWRVLTDVRTNQDKFDLSVMWRVTHHDARWRAATRVNARCRSSSSHLSGWLGA